MTLSRRLLLLAALLAGLAGASAARAQLQSFEKSTLAIETAGGKQVFQVEEARSPAQMSQGLMFRRQMAADAGMIFLYGKPQVVAFWMRNTLIPLDMLFIGADGRIATIHSRAVPLDETPISSKVPVVAVLELNGGTAERLGIKPGDKVVHPAFGG